jgi:hypothetical protein
MVTTTSKGIVVVVVVVVVVAATAGRCSSKEALGRVVFLQGRRRRRRRMLQIQKPQSNSTIQASKRIVATNALADTPHQYEGVGDVVEVLLEKLA